MAMFEDDYGDILRKARSGLGLSGEECAARSGLPALEVKELLAGGLRPREQPLRKLAAVLGLSPGKLADLALRPEPPRPVSVPPPFVFLPLDRAANAYVLGDSDTKKALIVDPGDEPDRIAEALTSLGLQPLLILVTHDHGDHVGALAEIRRRYPVPVVKAGHRALLEVGRMRGRVCDIPGHSPDSAVFVFEDRRVAFTGDALFARSAGGAEPGAGYKSQLAGVATEVLSLPPGTVLCPGHGPLTTAGDEKRLNPFFP